MSKVKKSNKWYNLAILGGGKVDRLIWTKKECFERCLHYNKKNKKAWLYLSNNNGGIVSGVIYTVEDCKKQHI